MEGRKQASSEIDVFGGCANELCGSSPTLMHAVRSFVMQMWREPSDLIWGCGCSVRAA